MAYDPIDNPLEPTAFKTIFKPYNLKPNEIQMLKDWYGDFDFLQLDTIYNVRNDLNAYFSRPSLAAILFVKRKLEDNWTLYDVANHTYGMDSCNTARKVFHEIINHPTVQSFIDLDMYNRNNEYDKKDHSLVTIRKSKASDSNYSKDAFEDMPLDRQSRTIKESKQNDNKKRGPGRPENQYNVLDNIEYFRSMMNIGTQKSLNQKAGRRKRNTKVILPDIFRCKFFFSHYQLDRKSNSS